MAKFAEVGAEERTDGCLGLDGWYDVRSIKDNWSISCSKDFLRVCSSIRSMDEVLNEVALGGLVDDFYNSSFLADFGDLIAVLLGTILNFLTALLMNIVQLCNVDLAASHITDELGFCCCVSLSNLFIDFLVSVCVDLIDSLGLNL